MAYDYLIQYGRIGYYWDVEILTNVLNENLEQRDNTDFNYRFW
jgi:hypothetical protein